jgi:hypothetical protein
MPEMKGRSSEMWIAKGLSRGYECWFNVDVSAKSAQIVRQSKELYEYCRVKYVLVMLVDSTDDKKDTRSYQTAGSV